MTDLVDDKNSKAVEGSKKGNGGFFGGGGGGQQYVPVEWPNTLRSNTTVRTLEAISEGEVAGLVDGAKSIYFDQTPLQNADGTYNFSGVEWDFHTGAPDQQHFVGNPNAETPIGVGVQMKQGQSIVRTIGDQNATSVRIITSMPSLYAVSTQGDTTAWTVSWAIEVRPAGGAWTTVGGRTLGGQKFTSPQSFQDEIILPAGGYPWDIRVTRTSGDSNGKNFVGETYWTTMIEVIAAKLSYPHTAVCQVKVDAAAFGQSTVPSRAFRIRGLIIDVPTNYNPETRAYSGIWDGTFKRAYTNNPAWILRDLIVNDRYGLGEFLSTDLVDKWALYHIAQYCDQEVPDGYGGTEPRYTLNVQIANKQEAFKLLQTICATFRGMAFWSINTVYASADMPSDPAKLYSNANVIDGQFNYSGTAIKARHTVALVTWYDPEDFYRPAVEVVIDDQMLKRYGWRELNLDARGCSTRSMAHRYGKWAIDTEKHAEETVEFVAGWDTADVRPGDIIAVADQHKAQVRAGGRIVSASGYKIVLDGVFEPGAGETYQLMVELPDKSVVFRPIASFNKAEVTLSSAFSPQPQVGAMWVITGTDIVPRQYRVMSREEREPHLYHIVALFHDPNKYARIEQGIEFDPLPYYRPPSTIKPPINLTFTESLYKQAGVPKNRLLVSWTPSDDFLAVRYRVTAQSPSQFIDYGDVNQVSFSIESPEIGEWEFHVSSVGITGAMSVPLIGTTTVKGWEGVDGPTVTHLEIFNNGGSPYFGGRDCKVVWTNNFPATSYEYGSEANGAGDGTVNPFYKDNIVNIYDVDTNTLLRTEVVYTESYTYTFEHNTEDYKPYGKSAQRRFRIEVSVRDTLGRQSLPAKLVCENPVPDLVLPNVYSSVSSIFVDYVKPDDIDFAGCYIWVDKDRNFNPLTTKPAYEGYLNAVSFPADAYTVYYVRLACYDLFGRENLNISPPVEIVVGGITIDNRPPPVPTGLALTTTAVTLADGKIDYVITANWDETGQMDPLPGAEPGWKNNFAYFDIEIAEGAASENFISYPTSQNNYQWSGLRPNKLYRVRVRAVSKNGFASGFCAIVELTSAKKTTPPATPTNLKADSAVRNVFLTWTNPDDPDLSAIEVWGGSTNVRADATLVGSVLGQNFTHSGLTTGQTYYYWVRAKNTSDLYSDYSAAPVAATPGAIQTDDIGTAVVDTNKITTNAINADKIAPNSVLSEKIGANAVIADKIAPGAITETKIDNSAVTTSKIAPGAVTEAKIDNSAVTVDKIAPSAVTVDKIAPLSISPEKIQSEAITPTKIAPNAVTTEKIDPLAVTGPKIAASAIDADKIAANAIVAGKIAANAIESDKIAANAITANKIAAGAIETDKLAANAITAEKISAGAISANKIAAAAIETDKIAANAITAGKIAAGAIETDKLAANAITADKLAANSVTADKIQADAITANKIAAGAISAEKLTISSRSLTVAGIEFSYVSASGVLSWTSGSLTYVKDDGTQGTVSITAGSATRVPPNSLYIAWQKDAMTLSFATTPFNSASYVPFATYRGGTDLVVNYGRSVIDGSQIIAGTITSNQIAAGTISADILAANSITAEKLSISSRSLTVSGVEFSYVAATGVLSWTTGSLTYIKDDGTQATVAITAGNATRVSPNTLYVAWQKDATTLSYATTPFNAASYMPFATYRGGTDLVVNYGRTVVDGSQIITGTVTANQLAAGTITGDKIAANAISAEKLTISSRGLSVEDLNFSFDKALNKLTWSSGVITYTKDDGTIGSVTIPANTTGVIWTGGTIYVAWKKDTTLLETATTSFSSSTHSPFATYKGGANLVVNYGRTVVDGSQIVTGSITTDQLAAGAITADKIATGVLSANVLTVGARGLSVEGIMFSYNSSNQLSWTAGKIYYIDDANTNQMVSIPAGSATLTSGTLYVAWQTGGTSLLTATSATTYMGRDYVTFATYRGGTDLVANYGRTVIDGAQIVTGTLSADRIGALAITSDKIAAGAIIAGKLATDSILAGNIKAGEITGDKLNVSTSLPATLTVGTTGVTIDKIADPAARINANTTQIDPGKILISGSTTLASWRNGADNTKIDGGNIAANTITANKLTIGSRGVSFNLLEFSADKTTQRVSWSSGEAAYAGDTGAWTGVSIAAGNTNSLPTFNGGRIYIFWRKGEASLRMVYDDATNTRYAYPAGTVLDFATDMILATYGGTTNLVANYGRTIIDGSKITTGTITSDIIAANAIKAVNIDTDAVTATKIQAGAVTADKIGAGTISATNAIYLGGSSFALSAPNQNLVVTDGNNRVRVRLGKLTGGTATDFGIQVYGSDGTLIMSSGAAIDASITLAKIQTAIGTTASGGGLDGTYIKNVVAQSLSSVSATLGDVTAGVARSGDSKFIMDLTNRYIVISD